MPVSGGIKLADANVWLALAFSDHVHHAGDPRVLFLPEPPGIEVAFRRFTRATSPSHALWTDAYLAAFAVENRIQLVSFDRGLARFAGLDLVALA